MEEETCISRFGALPALGDGGVLATLALGVAPAALGDDWARDRAAGIPCSAARSPIRTAIEVRSSESPVRVDCRCDRAVARRGLRVGRGIASLGAGAVADVRLARMCHARAVRWPAPQRLIGTGGSGCRGVRILLRHPYSPGARGSTRRHHRILGRRSGPPGSRSGLDPRRVPRRPRRPCACAEGSMSRRPTSRCRWGASSGRSPSTPTSSSKAGAISPAAGRFGALVVDPRCPRRRYRTALVERCIARARRVGAPTLESTTISLLTDAVRLYERLGFVRCPEFDLLAADVFPADDADDMTGRAFRNLAPVSIDTSAVRPSASRAESRSGRAR